MRSAIRWAGLFVLLVGCGGGTASQEVTFVGSDFTFTGPDTLRAGPTTFRFKNGGTVIHELALLMLRPGVTGTQAFDAERLGQSVDSIYEPGDGLLYVASGDHVDMSLLADLQAGRTYVLICTLDTGPLKTPHLKLGMFKSLTVQRTGLSPGT